MTMLRHDAPIRIHIYGSVRGKYHHDTTADLLDAALTVEAICNGRVSGYEGNSPPIKYRLQLLDESYALNDGELCTCARCVPAEEATS